MIQAEIYPHVVGWYKERASYYYDFATNGVPLSADMQTVLTAPLYVLVTGYENNNPIMVAGQHNIANATRGDVGYSDLWQIYFLTVDAGYVANTVRDADTALSMWGATRMTGPLVNCPVVEDGSTLAGGELNITYGWCRNVSIQYFDFGVSVNFVIPLYTFPGVANQNNIIDAIPSDNSSYSAFWSIYSVTPSASYVANTYKSFQDVANAGITPMSLNSVRNCPVVKTDPPTATNSGVISLASFALIFALFIL